MLFKSVVLQKIRTGEVTTAFRRWKMASVRAGVTLRTSVGVLAFDGVEPVDTDDITEADAASAGFATRDALLVDIDQGRDGTLYRISLRWQGEDPRVALGATDEIDADEFERLRSDLAALDKRSGGDDWTIATLRLIFQREGMTAGEIAHRLGIEKSALKLRVRKLKELGLTESLQSGYRLSRRGAAVLASMR